MQVTVNITDSIKRVQEFKEYDLGQITTTLQDLLDNSSTIIDSNTIPILKVLSIDNIVKNYLIKDLTESSNNISDYITGQDLTEDDLIFIVSEDQIEQLVEGSGGGSSVNTVFQEVTYSSTISHIFDSDNPNIFINLSGDLDLTYTGTSNGDSGLVNIYTSATENIVVNGTKSLVLTGDGEMIPIYFIHDDIGIRWYDGRDGEVTVDTSNLAVQDGTILYHTATATTAGTVTSSGTNWTGTSTAITDNMVGAKITVDGQTTIIATVNSGAQTFTTVDAIPATSETFSVRCIAYKVLANGSQTMYDKNGSARVTLDVDGYLNNFLISNGQITSLSGSGRFVTNFSKMEAQFIETLYYSNITRLVSELRTDLIAGTTAMVSDALTPVSHATVVGGGTVLRPVYWNGVNWLCY